MIIFAKWTVIVFGIFLIGVGFLMLFSPHKVGAILKKAGSTNLINYAEITIRMIPAAALVVYAGDSKFPDFFKILGWFMLMTSVVLYFVPKSLHHAYALKWAGIIKPPYFRLIAPFSMGFGACLIYAVS